MCCIQNGLYIFVYFDSDHPKFFGLAPPLHSYLVTIYHSSILASHKDLEGKESIFPCYSLTSKLSKNKHALLTYQHVASVSPTFPSPISASYACKMRNAIKAIQIN